MPPFPLGCAGHSNFAWPTVRSRSVQNSREVPWRFTRESSRRITITLMLIRYGPLHYTLISGVVVCNLLSTILTRRHCTHRASVLLNLQKNAMQRPENPLNEFSHWTPTISLRGQNWAGLPISSKTMSRRKRDLGMSLKCQRNPVRWTCIDSEGFTMIWVVSLYSYNRIARCLT